MLLVALSFGDRDSTTEVLGAATFWMSQRTEFWAAGLTLWWTLLICSLGLSPIWAYLTTLNGSHSGLVQRGNLSSPTSLSIKFQVRCLCTSAVTGRMTDGQRLIFEMTNLDNFHDAERQAGSEVFKIDLVDF